MAKDKDRTLNPATAQLKADKARALKKGKAAITAQRTERLASRNPARLERQIADLKASGSDGALAGRDKKQLEELEKQLGLVRKAREKVGDKGRGGGDDRRGRGGGFGNGDGGRGRGGERGRGGVLGKRSRGVEGDAWERGDMSSGSETDESVRAIPMPRDTPPPIPSSYGRGRGRGRGGPSYTGHHHHHNGRDFHNNNNNANMEPLGEGRERPLHALPAKPPETVTTPAAAPRTTYEAKPMVRDLRKEAVKAFMPAVVARKVMAVKGDVGGRLLEEEEVQRLERDGYMGVGSTGGKGEGGATGGMVVEAAPRVGERVGGDDDDEKRRLEEEEERFGREVRMEEVSDEDL
ncbi:MAG: hypothetical protein Q9169_005612 [Polycauliona sp. 2 TL-2023]